MSVNVVYHPAAPPLRRLIPAYVKTTLAGDAEPLSELLPPQWATIRWAAQGRWRTRVGSAVVEAEAGSSPIVFGPMSRAYRVEIEPPAAGWVLGLQPLGWAWLFSIPAAALADRAGPLESMLESATAARIFDALLAPTDESRIAALNAVFLDRLARRRSPEGSLPHAHEALADPVVGTTDAFARRLGLSARQAARLSSDAFGFPPKLLLRRQRFLRTLLAMKSHDDQPWANLLDPAYCDQPHFVRDFRYFMGCSPSAYFAEPRRLLRASVEARAAALGAPMQGLHPVAVA